MRRTRWMAAFGLLIAAACGDGSSGGNDPLQPPPGPAVMADTINIIDNAFGPTSVKIVSGGTVTWTWDAANTQQHNVRWGTVPGTTPPQSPTQATGAPFDVTLTTPGAYQYVCTLHSNMSGTVFVE